jgi:hypothetical protein
MKGGNRREAEQVELKELTSGIMTATKYVLPILKFSTFVMLRICIRRVLMNNPKAMKVNKAPNAIIAIQLATIP